MELIADEVGIETRSVLTGQIALKRLYVFTGPWCLMVVGNDERGWLQLMDERLGLGKVPVGVRLVPHTVEPYAADGAVVGE